MKQVTNKISEKFQMAFDPLPLIFGKKHVAFFLRADLTPILLLKNCESLIVRLQIFARNSQSHFHFVIQSEIPFQAEYVKYVKLSLTLGANIQNREDVHRHLALMLLTQILTQHH